MEEEQAVDTEEGGSELRIAVTGGKGGTGKSAIAVNLAVTLSEKRKRVLLVDADADSPSDFFLLNKKAAEEKDVNTFIPKIKLDKCTKCGACVKECPEHALFQPVNKPPQVMPKMCIGCKKCQLVCPFDAIGDGFRKIGEIKKANAGIPVIGGELTPTEPFSAKVVDEILEEMKKQEKEYDFIIMDTAAGTHCSVIHVLREADLVIVVTEPTPFGLKDSQEVISIVKKMNKQYYLVLNKAGISNAKPEAELLVEIPYDEEFVKSYLEGKPFTREHKEHEITKKFEKIAEEVMKKELRS